LLREGKRKLPLFSLSLDKTEYLRKAHPHITLMLNDYEVSDFLELVLIPEWLLENRKVLDGLPEASSNVCLKIMSLIVIIGVMGYRIPIFLLLRQIKGHIPHTLNSGKTPGVYTYTRCVRSSDVEILGAKHFACSPSTLKAIT